MTQLLSYPLYSILRPAMWLRGVFDTSHSSMVSPNTVWWLVLVVSLTESKFTWSQASRPAWPVGNCLDCIEWGWKTLLLLWVTPFPRWDLDLWTWKVEPSNSMHPSLCLQSLDAAWSAASSSRTLTSPPCTMMNCISLELCATKETLTPTLFLDGISCILGSPSTHYCSWRWPWTPDLLSFTFQVLHSPVSANMPSLHVNLLMNTQFWWVTWLFRHILHNYLMTDVSLFWPSHL